MMELGEYSRVEHQKIAQQVSQMELEARIFVGEGFSFLKADNSVLYFEIPKHLNLGLMRKAFSNKTILLKGSRKNALRKSFERLRLRG
jgi:UDP-N-acetylmuramoyl-tripeptide--D-alanyl-D-alanine ligase